MSQLEELIAVIRDNEAHRQALQSAQSQEALVHLFMSIATDAGLYVEEAVIEAAILAAQAEED